MTPTEDTLGRFEEASRLLGEVHDVVEERSVGVEPPSWCARRGWADFLRALPDDAVHAAERDGLGPHLGSLRGAPASLAALARAVERVVDLPTAAEGALEEVAARRASPRKRAQVAAFAALLEGLAPKASRVIDLGSGHGHLTRHLARALGLSAEGWERDPARVAVASSLAIDSDARFVVTCAREAAGRLTSEDLVVGLHACGELGDHAVEAALTAGASVAVVGCCMQKRAGHRAPLARTPAPLSRASLTIGHAALGLANVRDGRDGVEAELAVRTDSRVNRVALRHVLEAEGHAMAPGEEMRGVNRRRACGALEELVAQVFTTRGLAVPSPRVVAEGARRAREDYAHARRWELPRTMLARLVEVWIATDRAALLAQAGYRAEVRVVFGAEVSPRNVAVLGTRD